MHLPDYVEPFVDTEPGRWPLTGAVVVTIALALLSESQGWVVGYLVALVIGGAVTWLVTARASVAEPAEPLPRLPVFLRFDDRRVVVVGGGTMASAKIPALLAAGARVTVIAPAIAESIRQLGVDVIEREFAPDDLDGAWFVTAAATPEVNRAVRDAAESRGVFVNAVDDPANATAYLGGTIARGGVTVAFSTSGKAPALAGLLREGFDALLPQDIDRWAQRAHELSVRQRVDGVPMASRRPQLLDALNELYESRERRIAGR
jgi:siroheme synthase-like protein